MSGVVVGGTRAISTQRCLGRGWRSTLNQEIGDRDGSMRIDSIWVRGGQKLKEDMRPPGERVSSEKGSTPGQSSEESLPVRTENGVGQMKGEQGGVGRGVGTPRRMGCWGGWGAGPEEVREEAREGSWSIPWV